MIESFISNRFSGKENVLSCIVHTTRPFAEVSTCRVLNKQVEFQYYPTGDPNGNARLIRT